MSPPKIVSVVGARPQFVKAAAVLTSLGRWPERIESVLVHTGQHYDHGLSKVFFDDLPLPDPDRYLGVGSAGHGIQTGEMLKRLEPVLTKESPELVVVYGDTNSTLAGGLAAAKLGIPIAHVEAGLRSFRRDMAEEVNRVVVDHISTLHFCPTPTAIENLRREGISGGSLVGDVMLDVLTTHLPPPDKRREILSSFGLSAASYGVATIHRAQNTDDPTRLAGIVEGLAQVAKAGLPIVAPLHPRTSQALVDMRPMPGVTFTGPIGYLDMVSLVADAQLVLTDSGGVQREAFWLGVRCVTLRDETEWPETLESGWNRLAGAAPHRIASAAQAPIPEVHPDVYGRAPASDRIVTEIAAFVGAAVPEAVG